jgi:ribosome-associated toxin RatA of RatAB toxin-antitoxin module
MTRLFFLLAMAVTATAAAQVPPPSVTVREANGAYVVEARFRVAAPAGVIHRVLTDYDAIPRFMPDVRTSVVRRRAGGSVIVEQEAESSFLMFSKRVHLVLDILESERLITFRDLCGKSFDRYEGAWTLAPEGDQVTVTYTLTADPSFKVPGSVLRRLLDRNARQTIEHLRAEAARRAALN